MEDLKIGRNSQTSQTDLTLSTVSMLAISPDPYRISLIFCAPSAGVAHFSLGGTALTGFGIPIPANADPVELNLAEHGALVTRGWSVVASAGNPTLSIFATSYPYGDKLPLPPK